MRRYNIINNSLGWLMFAAAAFTYLLTLEPTASFWDCGEFISQGYKLEVGHPPGNPIFMLAARFFINFSCSPETVAICVNAMSALLSAGTILLLFWTITHLTRRLITKREDTEYSLAQQLIIFGSGIVGSLAYTWSDTFWFSAVEGEVYAFSSFCTALVFWLILKWENRADNPSSDKYLILIAYVIGVSIAVHLLNLLCIPAIVLVIYYRKFKKTNAVGSLIALLVSFAIIVFILYGLVPGFVSVAKSFDLFFVNTLGLPFNSGVIAYAVLSLCLFAWCIVELYRQKNPNGIKISFLLSILCCGILFIGDGILLPLVLTVGLIVYLFAFCKIIPVRIFNIIIMSILVIFIGYSSYALILIRSNAQTPMDQNSPDNVFALSSYLNREQYGQRPLLYGETFSSFPVYKESNGRFVVVTEEGKTKYAKQVKSDENQDDRYIETGKEYKYINSPETNMLFPRMYSSDHIQAYKDWTNLTGRTVEATMVVDDNGRPIEGYQKQPVIMPTMLDNLQFFLEYQLNYMYWRYFMWNFVGRQNDLQGQGEITHGNWISGISAIDNARLGDQSLLPEDLTTGNKGHNVFFFLPLLLGIIGLLWQAFTSNKGIEQFWVIFFLFFMTGIAIVIYLNQTPGQPRERDYAFAGSFYAFAIWIGLGVAGIWAIIRHILAPAPKNNQKKNPSNGKKLEDMIQNQDKGIKESLNTKIALIACILGIIVPLQMVSQTWDDHDRSGRYAARDFGMNYLSSVDKNAIIFTNGDNDTFPLWYAQEVEGYRTDVRVVNLSYLSTDWYMRQMRRQAYESAPLPMIADDSTFAYDQRQGCRIDTTYNRPVEALKSLKDLYAQPLDFKNNQIATMKYANMYVPVDKEAVVKNGICKDTSNVVSAIPLDMIHNPQCIAGGGIYSNKLMAIDIIASNAANGWNRPIYFAITVPDSYYLGLDNFMQSTGLAYELTPEYNYRNDNDPYGYNVDKMYDNIMNKFKWGGFDKATPENTIYVDETVRRMITTHRSTIATLALNLIEEAKYVKAELANKDLSKLGEKERKEIEAYPANRLQMAKNLLNLSEEKLPAFNANYDPQIALMFATAYLEIANEQNDKDVLEKAKQMLKDQVFRFGDYLKFYQSLSPGQHNRLSREDYRVEQYYFPVILRTYLEQCDEKGFNEIIQQLNDRGVNVEPVLQALIGQSGK